MLLSPRQIAAGICLMLAMYQLAGASMIYAKAWLAPILVAKAYAQKVQSGELNKPWPWADTYPVARLEVPHMNIERFILEGDSGHAMAFGAGMAAGVRPGEPGLVMISGHRDTHFRFLSELREADDIFLDYEEQGYHYKVVATAIADARDGFVPTLLPPQGLLLVTCYPFDAVVPGGHQRYVVVAERQWNGTSTL